MVCIRWEITNLPLLLDLSQCSLLYDPIRFHRLAHFGRLLLAQPQPLSQPPLTVQEQPVRNAEHAPGLRQHQGQDTREG